MIFTHNLERHGAIVWRNGTITINGKSQTRGKKIFYFLMDEHSQFIHLNYFFIISYHWSFTGSGGLEPIPADIGRAVGYTLDKWPIHHRADIHLLKSLMLMAITGNSVAFCKAIPPPLKTHDAKNINILKCFSHTTRRKYMGKALKRKIFSHFNSSAKLRIDNRTMRINTKYWKWPVALEIK